MASKYESSGTFARPGLLGRSIRIIAGLILLGFFFFVTTIYRFGGAADPRDVLFWIGMLIAFYFLPDPVNIPFGRSWGRRTQIVFVVLALGAGVFDLLRNGRFLGPVLTFLIIMMYFYVTGVVGLSFILSGIFAVPG